jgi:hypothetical protein
MSAQKWLFLALSPFALLPALLFVVGSVWVSWFENWINRDIDK